MSFPSPLAKGKLAVLLGFAVALAACSSNGTTTPATQGSGGSSVTTASTVYQYETTLAIPGVPPTGKTFSFDIGFVDEVAHNYYLADKATNGVDVVATLVGPYGTYMGTAGAGYFQGGGSTVAGFARSPNGGPNGDVAIGGGLVAAGDGNSTLKIVNPSNLTAPPVASINVPNPYTGPNLPPNVCQGPSAATGQPTVGAGNFRVDELAYDPVDNEIFAMSDNACPSFGTIFQATAPYTILHQFPLLDANGGAEQTIYDPTQGKFLSAIPSTTGNPNGAIMVFDPKAFTATEVGIPVNCVPSGFALGQNEIAMLGCTGSLTMINVSTFKVTNQLMGPSPDEVWYSAGTNRFYAADTGNGQLVVTDVNGNLIAKAVTSSGAHSVAV
jgi:hypothetical protein